MENSLEQKKTPSDYFESELAYLIEGGKNFAATFPTTAANLKLTPDGSDDPHVQQILESFSFLTGNIQRQIDQNSVQLSRTLLESLYPNLVTPIPCMSIIELAVNSSHPALAKNIVVPRGTFVTHDSAFNVNYKFKTVLDTPLFPGNIEEVKLERGTNYDFVLDKNVKALSIKIQFFAAEAKIDAVKFIRFYINAGKSISNKLYDHIFKASTECYIQHNDETFSPVSKNKITKVGFYEEESLLYSPKKHPENFKIFQEYFLFPEKFLFFDVAGIDLLNTKGSFKLVFIFNEFNQQDLNLDENSFKLRCTPVINLFTTVSEPIVTDKLKKTYSLYTNYLKEKFVFFHSISKVTLMDEKEGNNQVIPVANYQAYLCEKEKHYFYDFSLNEKDPNLFNMRIYADNKNIFLEKGTLYADILVSNGFFAEKLEEGIELVCIGEYPVNKCVMLKAPTNYLEGINDTNFYWKCMSYLYNDSINFTNLNNFIIDLKNLINLNIEIIADKSRALAILNAIEGAQIKEKSFKIKIGSHYSFIKGKEIILSVYAQSMVFESIVIFTECLFTYLQNISGMNQCVSLQVIDYSSKEVLHKCLPKTGIKRVF